jgi:hypothetical protein
MSRASRNGVAAAVAIALAVLVQAQSTSRIQLTIEPASFVLGRASILTIRVRVPDGHFIPAERSGVVTGAWLQPSLGGISRELPTYPAPTSVPLPGSGQKVLAYSGTAEFHMPVWALGGPFAPSDFTARFGYQLCDSLACAPPAIETAHIRLDVQEAPAPAQLLGYRVDAQRVALVTARHSALTSDPDDAIRPLAQFLPPVWLLPAGHPARSQFTGDFEMGSHWTIASNGPQFDALADQPAIVSWRCGGDVAPLAVMAQVADANFPKERAKYFLARRGEGASLLRSLSVPLQLDDAHRRALEDLINHQWRITAPTLFAANPIAREETPYDRDVREGRGRLVYHIEAFRLAPDNATRLYVRAYWKVGPRAQSGLTLWVRFDGEHFSVEQTDAAINVMGRERELRDRVDIAAQPEFAGILLNVIPGEDGWAYVILGDRGYESISVSVWKYSALGLQDTGIGYSHGC